MKIELRSAVDFLSNFIRNSKHVTEEQLNIFRTSLLQLLQLKYENHWFPEKPCKGSGYRCIRLNHNMDPTIREAGLSCTSKIWIEWVDSDGSIKYNSYTSIFTKSVGYFLWVHPHWTNNYCAVFLWMKLNLWMHVNISRKMVVKYGSSACNWLIIESVNF
jgi:hypothetical protein